MFNRIPIKTAEEFLAALEANVKRVCKDGKATSGGIDSTILAKFMPSGSKAYTFRCMVPERKVTDESKQAEKRAEICGLNHRIIDIYWEDIVVTSKILMINKGSPINSVDYARIHNGNSKYIVRND